MPVASNTNPGIMIHTVSLQVNQDEMLSYIVNTCGPQIDFYHTTEIWQNLTLN